MKRYCDECLTYYMELIEVKPFYDGHSCCPECNSRGLSRNFPSIEEVKGFIKEMQNELKKLESKVNEISD